VVLAPLPQPASEATVAAHEDERLPTRCWRQWWPFTMVRLLVVERRPGEDQSKHARSAAGEDRTSARIQCTACRRYVVHQQDGLPSDGGGLSHGKGAGNVGSPSSRVEPNLIAGGSRAS